MNYRDGGKIRKFLIIMGTFKGLQGSLSSGKGLVSGNDLSKTHLAYLPESSSSGLRSEDNFLLENLKNSIRYHPTSTSNPSHSPTNGFMSFDLEKSVEALESIRGIPNKFDQLVNNKNSAVVNHSNLFDYQSIPASSSNLASNSIDYTSLLNNYYSDSYYQPVPLSDITSYSQQSFHPEIYPPWPVFNQPELGTYLTVNYPYPPSEQHNNLLSNFHSPFDNQPIIDYSSQFHFPESNVISNLPIHSHENFFSGLDNSYDLQAQYHFSENIWNFENFHSPYTVTTINSNKPIHTGTATSVNIEPIIDHSETLVENGPRIELSTKNQVSKKRKVLEVVGSNNVFKSKTKKQSIDKVGLISFPKDTDIGPSSGNQAFQKDIGEVASPQGVTTKNPKRRKTVKVDKFNEKLTELLTNRLKEPIEDFKAFTEDLKETIITLDSLGFTKTNQNKKFERVFAEKCGVPVLKQDSLESSKLGELLRQDSLPIRRSFIENLKSSCQDSNGKDGKERFKEFFEYIELHIDRFNQGGSFYITNDQLENFLAEKSKYFLNPQLLRGPSIIPPLNLYSWWRVFKGRIGKASLEDIFKSDSVIFTERKISEYLTARNTPESLRKIRAMVISKFQIRNYFLIYSTLINKIFCESVKDVEQNFLKRQGQAIEFFESFWKICSIDRDGTFLIGEDKLRSIGNFDEVHLTQKNCLTDIKDFFNQTNYHELNTARQFKVMWSLINLWLIYYRSDLFIKTLSFGHQDRNFAFLVSSLLKFITINNSK